MRAKPVPPLPGKPTGLTATPGTDGSVALPWTAPGPNLYYWIYLRDRTSGEAFQKLLYPTANTGFTATGLTNHHVYEFKVAGTNVAGDGPDSDIASATVHYDRPPAPTNLRGTSSGDGTIALDWDAPAPNLFYWTYIRDVTAGQTSFTRNTYPTANTFASYGFLANGHVYEFKVTAENAGGEGPASPTIQVTARATLPLAPTNLRATPGDGQVRLDWAPSATPNVWYWIYERDVTAGQSWQRLPFPLDPANGGTTFLATYLTNGHTYEFKVAATNSAGDSPPSNVASARPVQARPAPPVNLTATPQPNQVLLSWNASPTPSVWYWVEYRDATIGQAWQRLPLPVGDRTTFTYPGLPAHVFEFRVRSTNGGGDSDPSNVAAARPLPPLAPTGLTVTSVGVGSVSLRWNASATPNTWYWVEYRDAAIGQAWQRTRYPISSGTTFTVGLLRSHNHEFRVRSTAASGDSDPSNVVSATPLRPAPPTGLTATPQPVQVLLRWNASTSPNVWYLIEYRTASGGPWSQLKYPVAGGTSFTFARLPELRWEFRVRSTNFAGDSDPSNVATAEPLPPLPPSNLTAAAGDTEVTMRWSPSPTSNVWYWPEYRNLTRNYNWVQALYPIPGTSWTPGFLTNGEVYQFRVRAMTAYSLSAYSNIALAMPFPPWPSPPSNLSASTSTAYSTVNLSWWPSPTPRVSYWIWWRMAGDRNWSRSRYAIADTHFSIVVPGGEVSEFAVQATNMAGDSSRSNGANAYARQRMGGFGWRLGNITSGANNFAWPLTRGPCMDGDHQRICFNSVSAAFNRPMTVGDYLLYPYSRGSFDAQLVCEAYKRANIRFDHGRQVANDRGPNLLGHEARHSTQWSWYWYDFRAFLAAYAIASGGFESDANLWWGGYNKQSSGSWYGRGGNCNYLY